MNTDAFTHYVGGLESSQYFGRFSWKNDLNILFFTDLWLLIKLNFIKSSVKTILDTNPQFIAYIRRPSKEMQLFVTDKYYEHVKYIRTPCEEVLITLLKHEPFAIKDISEPNKNMILTVVNINGDLVTDIDLTRFSEAFQNEVRLLSI
ncbi:MAG: hypothetical protein DRG78_00445 [Epsilonproteobacteria bacterium]|nr:MAG: hypothetical protein DRG78_00445 [Campylobacterota bacterium]